MPTRTEKLQAAKLRAEQAIARHRQLEAETNKHHRKQDTKLKFLLGLGATNAGLVDTCLQHLTESQRATALAILKEQADQARTDQPQDPTTE